MACPAGTFFNVISEACEDCMRGTYQPDEGQLTCLVCPNNTSTSRNNSKSIQQCHGVLNAKCNYGVKSDDSVRESVCNLSKKSKKSCFFEIWKKNIKYVFSNTEWRTSHCAGTVHTYIRTHIHTYVHKIYLYLDSPHKMIAERERIERTTQKEFISATQTSKAWIRGAGEVAGSAEVKRRGN